MTAVDNIRRSPLPAARARAAAPAAKPLPEFKTVYAYESFVRSSDVMQLPAAKARVGADQQKLDQANAALAQRKRETRYDELAAAKADAEAKLDAANHPMRAQAQTLRNDAASLGTKSAAVQAQISVLQAKITNIQAQRAANSTQSTGLNDGSVGGALLDIAVSGVAYAADQSTINGYQKQIATLISQKAALDTEAMVKTTTAATLDVQPGAPEVVKPFKDALASATAAFDQAAAAIKPAQDAVGDAQRALAGDTGTRDRLTGLEKDLQDYDNRFSVVTRTQLWWSDHSWKQHLDGFWKQLGL